MSKPYVKQTIVNNISYIEFYHPSQNSLPGELLQKLEYFIKKAGNHQDVKVIVLQSGGDRTFCAGASFKELVNISDEDSGKTFFFRICKCDQCNANLSKVNNRKNSR